MQPIKHIPASGICKEYAHKMNNSIPHFNRNVILIFIINLIKTNH